MKHLIDLMSKTAHRFAKHSLTKCQGAVVAIAVLFSFAALSPASAYADESNTSAQLEEQVSDTLTTTTSGLTPSSTTEVSNSEAAAKENSSSNDENTSGKDVDDTDGSATDADSDVPAADPNTNTKSSTSSAENKSKTTVSAQADTTDSKPVDKAKLGTLTIEKRGQDAQGKSTGMLSGASFVVSNAKGEYLTSNDTEAKWGSRADAKTFTTDGNGSVKVENLPAGTYTVTEIQAPQGYELPQGSDASKSITLTEEQLGNVSTGSDSATTGSSDIDPVYAGDYSIKSVLSEFHAFTEGDINAGNQHIVGALAAGGTIVSSGLNGGQGSVTNTYINVLKQNVSNGSGWGNCQYISDTNGAYKDCPYQVIYYGSTDSDDGKIEYNGSRVYPEDIKGWLNGKYVSVYKKVPGAINFTSAFAKIREESTSVAKSGVAATKVGDYAVVDLDKAFPKDATGTTQASVTIDYSMLKDAKGIKFKSTQYTKDEVIKLLSDGVQDSNGKKNQLTVSIVGVNGEPITLDYQSGSQYSIELETKDSNGKLFGLFVNGQKDYNGEGMRLIWNLPDASSSLVVSGYSGHIVAPNANVEAHGGEGNIIAKSVTVNNEIHFYPYYPTPESPRRVTSGVVQFVDVKKPTPPSKPKKGKVRWTKKDLNLKHELAGSVWTLTKVSDDRSLSEKSYVIDDASADNASQNDVSPSLANGIDDDAKEIKDMDPKGGVLEIDNLDEGDYILEEVQAPNGYKLNDTASDKNANRYRFTVSDSESNRQLNSLDDESKAASSDQLTTSPLYRYDGSTIIQDNTITNAPETGKISWAKVDADLKDSSNIAKYLGGSEWELAFTSDSDSGTTTTYTVVDAQTPDEIAKCKASHEANVLCDTDSQIGRITVENLGWGKYTLTETKAPDGYLIAADENGASKTWTAIIGREHDSEQIDLATLDWNLGEIANQKKTYSVPSTGRLGGIPTYILAGFAILLIGARLTAQMRKEW